MTDRAEPGVTPLTETDIANVREVLDSQVRLGHAMTLMPTDVLARILDAATPRPGLTEALRALRDNEYERAKTARGGWSNGYLAALDDIERALASGTGEPGLDVERLAVQAAARLEQEVSVLRTRLHACTESFDWLAANSVPQHSATCAGQDDDAPCICGVSERYEAVLANDKGADPTPEPK
jgi:hypothetical protein